LGEAMLSLMTEHESLLRPTLRDGGDPYATPFLVAAEVA
jgi:hypothetical protein